ncbi:hypothetical protein DL95DRAFT_312786 [Leptodontidium sp. 2 PMI_412]|nr:hypothetical protein DL95DRAFT_312786 [Leptodontidium sp. 2 PMI_412]
MAGWWRCCQDGREVNSRFWGGTCPDCSHEICISCEDEYGDSGEWVSSVTCGLVEQKLTARSRI